MDTVYYIDSPESIKAAFGRGYLVPPASVPAMGRIGYTGPSYAPASSHFITLIRKDSLAGKALASGDYVLCELTDFQFAEAGGKRSDFLLSTIPAISTNYISRITCQNENQLNILNTISSQFPLPECVVDSSIVIKPSKFDSPEEKQGKAISPIELDVAFALVDTLVSYCAHVKCLSSKLFSSLPADFLPKSEVAFDKLCSCRQFMAVVKHCISEDDAQRFDETYWLGPLTLAEPSAFVVLSACMRQIADMRKDSYYSPDSWPIQPGIKSVDRSGRVLVDQLSQRLNDLKSKLPKQCIDDIALFYAHIARMLTIDPRIEYGDVKNAIMEDRFSNAFRAISLAMCAVLRWWAEPHKAVKDYEETVLSKNGIGAELGFDNGAMGLFIVRLFCGYTNGGIPRVGFSRPSLANIVANEAVEMLGYLPKPLLIASSNPEPPRNESIMPSDVDSDSVGKWVFLDDVPVKVKSVSQATFEKCILCEVSNRYGYSTTVVMRLDAEQTILSRCWEFFRKQLEPFVPHLKSLIPLLDVHRKEPKTTSVMERMPDNPPSTAVSKDSSQNNSQYQLGFSGETHIKAIKKSGRKRGQAKETQNKN